MREAVFLGADVPVTIRLTPVVDQAGTPGTLHDDTLRISLGSDPTSAPLPPGVAAGDVTTTLTGRIAGALRFSQDAAGYGTLGAVELGFGDMALTGTGFNLVNDANPATCALMTTSDPVSVSEATGSQGHIDLFGGTFSMDLHTSFAFSALIRNSCGDPFVTTSVMDGTGRPPLPLRIDGSFRVSPALTADGHLRLGKLALSGPQRDSFVQVRTCTAAPPPANCAVADDSILPGRLMATSFTAELLVGNIA